jgi:hypothetical protein
VRSDGVRKRVDGFCRFRGLGAGVHAHVGEIGAKARLEKGAQPRIERAAGCAQRLFDRSRRLLLGHIGAHALALQRLLLGGAFGADAIDARRGESGGQSVPGRRHAHDLICGSVGIALEGVVHRADFELCLQPAQHRLVAGAGVPPLRTRRVSRRWSTRPLSPRRRRHACQLTHDANL